MGDLAGKPRGRAGHDFCPHGWDDHLWKIKCWECRLIRIEAFLDRIVEIAEFADSKQRGTL